MSCAHLPPVGRLCGARSTKRNVSRLFGPDVTVVADQSERETENLLPLVVCGEKHGWSCQPDPEQGNASGVATRRLHWRASVWREGAAKSAYLQSIGTRWPQAPSV